MPQEVGKRRTTYRVEVKKIALGSFSTKVEAALVYARYLEGGGADAGAAQLSAGCTQPEAPQVSAGPLPRDVQKRKRAEALPLPWWAKARSTYIAEMETSTSRDGYYSPDCVNRCRRSTGLRTATQASSVATRSGATDVRRWRQIVALLGRWLLPCREHRRGHDGRMWRTVDVYNSTDNKRKKRASHWMGGVSVVSCSHKLSWCL